VTWHIDAVDLATIYDDVTIVAAADALDCHYTTITAADSGLSATALTERILIITLHFARIGASPTYSKQDNSCKIIVCKTN